MAVVKGLIAKIRSIHQREAGVSTIGAALLMLAFMSAGAGVSYATVSQGDNSAEVADQVIGEALDNTTEIAFVGNVVYVSDDDGDGAITPADSITFSVSPAPGSAIDPAGLVVSVLTEDSRDAALAFTVNELRGDNDGLIESGELTELTIAAPEGMAAGEQFTIELQYGGGPVSTSARTMPPAIDGLMTLY